MLIKFHRGSKEIGGTCIEVETRNSRILMDTGVPLESDNIEAKKRLVPASLSESLRRRTPALSGILISHPHQDHYGLLPLFPRTTPVYAGQFASVLMKLTNELSRRPKIWTSPKPISDRRTIRVGEFVITPYIMDHSGFDSYALLVEADGKKLFYSGDFRGHGRKRTAFKQFIGNAPEKIDALILEGTTIGNARDVTLSEDELQAKFVESMKTTPGAVFITLAGQNIDRIVTAYKAAKETKRLFIIDPYIAEILDRIKKQYDASGITCHLPHASWRGIGICYPERLCSWLKNKGLGRICSRHMKYKLDWNVISRMQVRIVMIIRPSSADEVTWSNLFNLSEALWICSMWEGYLMRDKKLLSLYNDFKVAEASREFLHTSGHADLDALLSMVNALKPSKIIPVHTSHPEMYNNHFPNVVLVEDGKQFEL